MEYSDRKRTGMKPIATRELDPKQLSTQEETNDPEKAELYAEQWRKGAEPPPIVVGQLADGSYVILDGQHRAMAAAILGKKIKAEVYSHAQPDDTASTGAMEARQKKALAEIAAIKHDGSIGGTPNKWMRVERDFDSLAPIAEQLAFRDGGQERLKARLPNAPTAEIDPSELRTLQTYLKRLTIDHFLEEPEDINRPHENKWHGIPYSHPLVFVTDQGLFLGDGNHRATAAAMLGMKLKVTLVDMREGKPSTKDSVFSGVFGMGYYHELPVAIENPKGSIRSGAREGEFWSAKMPADYGYVRCTRGADDMQVDCFVGPDPASNLVLIVDQKNLDTGAFDEHKCMLGFTTAEQARACYVAAFSDGVANERIMHATVCSMDDFKKWLASGDLKRPYRGQ